MGLGASRALARLSLLLDLLLSIRPLALNDQCLLQTPIISLDQLDLDHLGPDVLDDHQQLVQLVLRIGEGELNLSELLADMLGNFLVQAKLLDQKQGKDAAWVG